MSVSAVAKKLGGKRVLGRELKSDTELIEAIRAGLPASALDSVFEEFAEVVGIQAAIYQAVGKARTLQRKRAEGRPLSTDESDRLARLARLVVRSEQALGNRDKAHRWLAKPNRALGGQRPLALLDSDAGALAVERLLGRIEHGVHT
ncbi:MAG: type II RES/Xre toxin-antitoxin system antitoxin [Gemmatimonadaceae bacterium]